MKLLMINGIDFSLNINSRQTPSKTDNSCNILAVNNQKKNFLNKIKIKTVSLQTAFSFLFYFLFCHVQLVLSTDTEVLSKKSSICLLQL